MLGAIIGDIAGSRFEFSNHRSKEFELFHPQCSFTDDSVMTLALAQAVMNAAKAAPWGSDAFYAELDRQSVRCMQDVGRHYPYCGYGGNFGVWIRSQQPTPYNSFGNGAAMRVSAAGFAAGSEEEAKKLSHAITAVTHNHPEGLKGAEATALCIYLARTGHSQAAIRERVIKDYYPLDFTIDQIRPHYQFNETCQDTVPQAIQAFLEAQDFEDAIRTAVSVGGDSDTLAAITGSIAEGFWGVPPDIREKALSFLDKRLLAIYHQWEAFAASL